MELTILCPTLGLVGGLDSYILIWPWSVFPNSYHDSNGDLAIYVEELSWMND